MPSNKWKDANPANHAAKYLRGSRSRVAIIDADTVIYAVACSAEGKTGPDSYIQLRGDDECVRDCFKRMEEYIEEIEAETAIAAVSITTSYRNVLLPSYKSNRSTMHKPIMLPRLRELVLQNSRKDLATMAIAGLEADDVVGIAATSLQKADLREPIIVSIDKDMRSIPGLLWSPMHPEAGVVETSGLEADRCHLMQTLTGDAVDGYKGCPGIGKVKAASALATAKVSRWWGAVVSMYMDKGLTAEDALTQARVARILRDVDWNPDTREIDLWLPQTSNAKWLAANARTISVAKSQAGQVDRTLH